MLHTEDRHHFGRHVRRLRCGGQLNEPRPVREGVPNSPRQFDHQAGLTGTAGTSHRHQAAVLEQPSELGRVVCPADEARQQRRKSRRTVYGRPVLSPYHVTSLFDMAISPISNSWSRINRRKVRLIGFTSTNSAASPRGGGSRPSKIASEIRFGCPVDSYAAT